jgi:hypothetical protein
MTVAAPRFLREDALGLEAGPLEQLFDDAAWRTCINLGASSEAVYHGWRDSDK